MHLVHLILKNGLVLKCLKPFGLHLKGRLPASITFHLALNNLINLFPLFETYE